MLNEIFAASIFQKAFSKDFRQGNYFHYLCCLLYTSAKDTHLNIKEVPECVINIVNYNMVQQMSLASSPFPKGVSEFTKAGFTPSTSDLVKPMLVKESPVQLECKVFELKEIGNCNLVMCEIVKIHIDESILNEQNMIDQQKIDLVARMGGNWYCRAHGLSLIHI